MFAGDLLCGGCFADGIHTRVDGKYHEVTMLVVGLGQTLWGTEAAQEG